MKTNHLEFTGVLTKTPEGGTSGRGTSWARAQLRAMDGEYVPLVAFGAVADLLLMLREGDSLGVAGRWQRRPPQGQRGGEWRTTAVVEQLDPIKAQALDALAPAAVGKEVGRG